MSTRYSGKAFKDSSQMKKAKLSTKEKKKLKKEKKKNKVQQKNEKAFRDLGSGFVYSNRKFLKINLKR